MQETIILSLLALSLCTVLGIVLWVFSGCPTRSPWKQAKIDDMSQAALNTAYVYNRSHASASPDQAKRIQAEIDRYRARVNAIEDELWREAHMVWVRYSERNLAKSIEKYEELVHDRQRDAELGPRDPLAIAA